MKKSLLVIIFIILLGAIYYFFTWIYKEIPEDNNTENSIEKLNYGSFNYEEKTEKIKGKIDKINKNSSIIHITDTYHFDGDGMYFENNQIKGYDNMEIIITEDTHVVNYMDLSDMKIESIEQGDILVYEGKTEYISKSMRKINNEESNILILKNNDLKEMLLQQYKGITKINDVNFIYETAYINKYKEKYIWGKFNIKTFRNDELTYILGFKISDNTIVKEGTSKKNADIILEDDLENETSTANYGNVRKIKAINYK